MQEMKLKREDKKKDVSRELSQTTAAIRNLFGRCFNSMRVKPVFNGHKDNAALMEVLEFELDVIHIRIADLKDITNEFNTVTATGELPQPPMDNTNSSSVNMKENSGSLTLPNVGSLSLGSRF
mmetsp:Transcript_15366/g.22574  ORF Transcript_15366/g.22574 Transcript_15366/m.22574 type:complete len:123 (-) Transcript_15366:1645-2013(-)